MALFKKNAPVDQDKVFKAIKKAFDSNEWTYKADDAKKIISINMMGDDLPIPTLVSVDEISVYFLCNLYLSVPPSKYQEVAYELNKLNYGLKFGKFSLSETNGSIVFSYGYLLGPECPPQDMITAMFHIVVSTVDEHDGALSKLVTSAGGKKNSDDAMYQ